jgi:hypothetical protein
MLQGIAAKQELVIPDAGAVQPGIAMSGICSRRTGKMAEAAGLKNPEQYFPEITQEQIQQFAAQQARSSRTLKPPRRRRRMQIEQMKLQANMQLEQARMQADQGRDAAEGGG